MHIQMERFKKFHSAGSGSFFFGLLELLQEGQVQLLLRPLPGLDGFAELLVAAQVTADALEADRGAPAPLPCEPIHAGHAAGVVAPHGTGPDHLHAGPVHIGQAGPPNLGRGLAVEVVVAAAGRAQSVAQAGGGDHRLLPAIAAAQPRRAFSDIFGRGQYGQFSESLSGQVQSFP